MHGVEYRGRREDAGAPDADLNLAHLRQLFFGRELEGDRPFRGFRGDAKHRAQRDVVELDDDSVGIDRVLEAFRLP